MTELGEGPFDDFSQEADDLIDATVEDPDPASAVKRMEEPIGRGFPKAQAAVAYQVLGTRYEDMGDMQKAIESYTKSLEIDRSNPLVLFWRGELLFHMGKRNEARADLMEALAFDPPNALFSPDRDQALGYLARMED
jgi:tetratricopeptide (TPR) repeat protein